jgi:hypothetical protein
MKKVYPATWTYYPGIIIGIVLFICGIVVVYAGSKQGYGAMLGGLVVGSISGLMLLIRPHTEIVEDTENVDETERRLNEIAYLKRKGLITAVEYQKKRNEIINRL